jgi:ABC-2 type transport system permease protein
MREDYDFEKIDLRTIDSLRGYDLIIIGKPDSVFTDDDKFKIDQYLVRGGNALFFVDMMNAHLDSIGENGTYAFPKNLNLDDLFFKYGLRVNSDLISDLQSGYIPMFTGYVGDQKQTQLMPWRLYPIINNYAKHPITKGLDVVYTKFVSTIDTVKADGITKTPLLFSSKYAKIHPSPARLNFNESRIDPDPKIYNKGPLPIAYLLEGKFESLFKNKLLPESEKRLNFISKQNESKIIVISDGDIFQNEINKKDGKPIPLGYDRFTRQFFANKALLTNMVNYLIEDKDLILVKSKEVTLRPLDKIKLRDERLKWQIINIVTPILLVIILGVILFYIRNKKYKA